MLGPGPALGRSAAAGIARWVVPVVVKAMGDSRAEVKKANEGLVMTLYSVMGDALFEVAGREEDRKAIKALIGVY
jgi:hypothetical protein